MDVKILVLACLMPFALGGCAGHSHSLILDQSDQNIAVGTFQHEGLEEAVMVLELRGVRFEAPGFRHCAQAEPCGIATSLWSGKALRPDFFWIGH